MGVSPVRRYVAGRARIDVIPKLVEKRIVVAGQVDQQAGAVFGMARLFDAAFDGVVLEDRRATPAKKVERALVTLVNNRGQRNIDIEDVDLRREGVVVTLIAERIQFNDVSHGGDAPDLTQSYEGQYGPIAGNQDAAPVASKERRLA